MPEYDVILRGARTIDPETGLDGVCDVAVVSSTIAAVAVGGDEAMRGRLELDVSGQVLAPGFIDLHSHCRDFASRALRACDGVTTALELEGGEIDVEDAYHRAGEVGSSYRFGFCGVLGGDLAWLRVVWTLRPRMTPSCSSSMSRRGIVR